MINNPIYDKNIIVGIIFKDEFNWYITDKLFWILDLKKISKFDYNNCLECKEFKEIRKDIDVLSEKNIELFLNRIEKYKIDINNLRIKILDEIKEQKEEYELEEYYPSLLLDFTEKILYSQYSEPFGFENYIPDNWKGKYISFIDMIEDENKYWMYKNKNLLI